MDLGLTDDPTQKFHLTIATLATTWMPFHPKSAFATSEHGQSLQAEMAEASRILRHGDPSTGFLGFNDDSTTGWTTHAKTCAQWGKENIAIQSQIAKLPKGDDSYEASKADLAAQLRDIRSLGFCNPVGSTEKLICISTPLESSQDSLLARMQAQHQKFLEDIESYQ